MIPGPTTAGATIAPALYELRYERLGSMIALPTEQPVTLLASAHQAGNPPRLLTNTSNGHL
jgi:hypothetical protein